MAKNERHITDAKELINQLGELGLSTHVSRTYLELSKLGTTTAGPLIARTKLHRQQVYAALERLEDQKLVSVMVKRNRKLFTASPPAELVRIQKERQVVAQNLVPILSKLRPQDGQPLEIRVLFGEEEFFKNLITAVECAARDDHILRVIGGASDEQFYNLVGNNYDRYLEACQDAKIRKHLLAPADAADRFKEIFAAEPGNDLRLVENGLSAPTYTRITRDMVSIEIYDREVVMLQIWSRTIARSYREHFGLLWAKARKYSSKSQRKS